MHTYGCTYCFKVTCSIWRGVDVMSGLSTLGCFFYYCLLYREWCQHLLLLDMIGHLYFTEEGVRHLQSHLDLVPMVLHIHILGCDMVMGHHQELPVHMAFSLHMVNLDRWAVCFPSTVDYCGYSKVTWLAYDSCWLCHRHGIWPWTWSRPI